MITKKFWKTFTKFPFLKRLSCYLSACCAFCAAVCVFSLLSVLCDGMETTNRRNAHVQGITAIWGVIISI